MRLIDLKRKNETVVVGAGGIGENPKNTGANCSVRFQGLGDVESGMRERTVFPPFPGAAEKEGVSSPFPGMGFSAG
jgi:hypothetical protein